jgi:hypothetical protein
MATTRTEPCPLANDRRNDAIAARRRRLFATAIGIVTVLAAASSARAGGLPDFSAAEQQAWCESVAASRVGPESWDEAIGAYDEADRVLADVETQLCLARFDAALTRVQRGRSELADLPESWESDRRRARLEILAATAKIAMDDVESARLNFRWALEIDPYLELDPVETSPKVLQMFRESRASFVAAR